MTGRMAKSRPGAAACRDWTWQARRPGGIWRTFRNHLYFRGYDMADVPKLAFGAISAPARGVLGVFCDDGLKFGPATRKVLGAAADLVQRAAKSERFAGKRGSSLDLIHPEGMKVARLTVVGIGEAADLAQGARLRTYAFDRYKTKRKDDETAPAKRTLTVAVGDVGAARRAFARREAIRGGVPTARA